MSPENKQSQNQQNQLLLKSALEIKQQKAGSIHSKLCALEEMTKMESKVSY